MLGYRAILIGCRTGSVADKIKEEVTREIEKIWKVLAAYRIDGDRITFASFSTDGVDGHSDLAGAIADPDTLAQAREKGLDYRQYLARYDSASFFKALGLDFKTGPTGTNVADVTLTLLTHPDRPDRQVAIISEVRPRSRSPCRRARNRAMAAEHPHGPAGRRKLDKGQ